MYNLHDKVSRRVGTLGTTITAHCGGAIDLSRSSGALGHSLGALAEAVLEAARQGAHVAHPAGALSAAALGLGGPVVTTHGRRRVSARRASRLLDVVRAAAAAPAHGVRLVVALAEAASSLACLAHGSFWSEFCNP